MSSASSQPSARDIGANDSRVAFIIAAPRSGTTWLKEALNAHPDTLGVERRLFGMYCDIVQDAGGAMPRVRITLDRYVDSVAGALGVSPRELRVKDLRSEMLRETAQAQDEFLLRNSGRMMLIEKLTPYSGTADA